MISRDKDESASGDEMATRFMPKCRVFVDGVEVEDDRHLWPARMAYSYLGIDFEYDVEAAVEV